jgi:sugar lactone lactonase YvrE
MYFTVGLGSNPTTRTGILANLGLLMRVPAGESIPVVVADVSGYEALHNPAGGPVDSNPFHLAVSSGGVLVADAGANAILNVGPDGSVNLVATLSALPSGAEAVPTSLAVGADGTVYVSQLTGFPFPAGGASVFRVDGTSLSAVATGFTNVIDLTTGPDGMLYVLELAHFGLTSGSPTGGLWKVDPSTGAKHLLFSDGLFLPTAIAFDADGDLFIANRGVIPGQGEVLELSPVPEPSIFGASAAVLLIGLIGRRRFRRTQAAAT